MFMPYVAGSGVQGRGGIVLWPEMPASGTKQL